jgi:hypothetical protein
MIVYFFKKSKRVKIILLIIVSVLTLLYICFILTKLHKGNQPSIQIIRKEAIFEASEMLLLESKEGNEATSQFPFVASKRGVYYYPINCSKAKTLSVKNMLYFKDKTAAERAGYKQNLGC